MKFKMTLITTFLSLSIFSAGAHAQADDGDVVDQVIQMGCQARQAITDRVNQFWDDAERVVCGQLDLKNRYEESPYLWVSDDAQCDMNYSMPGLPSFSGKGSSSCQTLKSITGDMVDEANRHFQGAVDDALVSVGREPGEVTVDLDELARDVISNQK